MYIDNKKSELLISILDNVNTKSLNKKELKYYCRLKAITKKETDKKQIKEFSNDEVLSIFN